MVSINQRQRVLDFIGASTGTATSSVVLKLNVGGCGRPVAALPCFGLSEHTRDFGAAMGTAPFCQLVRQHGVPGALDHDLLASGTDRVAAVGEDIALVHVLQSHLQGHASRAVERFWRGGWLVLQ